MCRSYFSLKIASYLKKQLQQVHYTLLPVLNKIKHLGPSIILSDSALWSSLLCSCLWWQCWQPWSGKCLQATRNPQGPGQALSCWFRQHHRQMQTGSLTHPWAWTSTPDPQIFLGLTRWELFIIPWKPKASIYVIALTRPWNPTERFTNCDLFAVLALDYPRL